MYRLKDLMMMFDIPERTIRRHLKIGLLRGTKIGGSWRFTLQDIATYLDAENINKSLRSNFLRHVNDYLNGFTKIPDSVLISVNKPKLSRQTMEDLSELVNGFREGFLFHTSVQGGTHNISFIGDVNDARTLLNHLSENHE